MAPSHSGSLAVAFENERELARLHASTDVGCVRGVVEEGGAGVEGDAGASVAEYAADVATSRLRSMIRWLAKVWRRSWTRRRVGQAG
jgi:hypothetical protein